MKNIIFLFSLLFIIVSCEKAPETRFTKEGVAFTYPSGWKISEEQNFDGKGYYLSIEKEGLNSSGVLSITWINDSLDLLDFLKTFQSELKNNIIYKNSNLNFDSATTDKYSTFNTISSKYTVSILTLKHKGTLYIFHATKKTFAILKQEALEDIEKNEEGFQTLEQSFSVVAEADSLN